MGLRDSIKQIKAARELMSVTGGLPSAIGSITTLTDSGMSFPDAINFVKERGLPDNPKERRDWWQKNYERIREQVNMRMGKGGESE